MDFDKRQAVADIIPVVFNQMIAFVQSAEVKCFADRFYKNTDTQYLTIVASKDTEEIARLFSLTPRRENQHINSSKF